MSDELDKLSADELKARLDMSRLPVHLAVIMDGNRRWAESRFLPSVLGHKAGVKAFRRVMETCRALGIKYLTAYAFSAENWCRAASEVSMLMQLFEQSARNERETMYKNGIRLHIVGSLDKLPEAVRNEFAKTVEYTKDCRDMTLNLAVNYGAREEIVRACRNLAAEVAQGHLNIEDIDETRFNNALWTEGQPDPDFMIRTSGELRISNFLLWQSAYTEFYYSKIMWPEVDAKFIYRALLDYQLRSRRFGGT